METFIQIAKDALAFFNDVPNFRLRHDRSKSSYDLAAHIGKCLKAHEAQEVETFKMLCLSTAHINAETRQMLDDCECNSTVVYQKGEYGWFVYRTIDESETMPEYFPPADLNACFDFAKEQGCDWIMFDCDVDAIEALPKYVW